jgi:hypothetical protein
MEPQFRGSAGEPLIQPKYRLQVGRCRQIRRGAKYFPELLHFSKAKIRFQSFFVLMTVQPLLFASSYNDCGKVPILVAASWQRCGSMQDTSAVLAVANR